MVEKSPPDFLRMLRILWKVERAPAITWKLERGDSGIVPIDVIRMSEAIWWQSYWA